MSSLRHRPKFISRKIILAGEAQRSNAITLIQNLPIDSGRPLAISIGEDQKPRKLDQNALMWAGPLKDIAEQGWINGHQLHIKTWHEIFKETYLPEGYDEELTKKDYVKWGYKPNGDRVLIGSTTDLTVKGFAQYMEQVYADGASLGVQFHANPNEIRMAA